MKAVIMAGGEGQRLRPLTCCLPKPMVPVLGRPVLEYIFDLLIEAGVTQAVLTLGYLPEIIEESYRDGYKNLALEFVREDTPLGTAGGVKNAIGDYDGTLLVISGDAMCDFNLSQALDFHKGVEADATVISTKVEEPREYGLITCESNGKISGFIEKPSWSQAVSGLANTGIYIIESAVLKRLNKGEKSDFSKDIFPSLLAEKKKLFTFEAKGYWCDVGGIEAYMKCQRDVIDGKLRIVDIVGKTPCNLGKEIRIIPPVYIDSGAEISSGAELGPYAFIGKKCTVGKGAKIRYSTVLENACIYDGSMLTGALICPGATVKKRACIFENCVVGSEALIGSDCTLKPGVMVWPGKTVASGAHVCENVKYGSFRRSLFFGDSIGGESESVIDTGLCLAFGAAVGGTENGKRCAIGYDGSKTASVMLHAVMAGLTGAGGGVWNFGESFRSQLNYLVSFCGLGTGIFLSGADERQITVCGKGGLPITRAFERKLESTVNSKEFALLQEDKLKEISEVSSIKNLYEQALIKQAPGDISGIAVSVSSSSALVEGVMNRVLNKLGRREDNGIRFVISPCGTSAEAVDENGTVDFEKLVAVCCLDEFRKGRDVSVPYDAPRFLDSLAQPYGRKVLR